MGQIKKGSVHFLFFGHAEVEDDRAAVAFDQQVFGAAVQPAYGLAAQGRFDFGGVRAWFI